MLTMALYSTIAFIKLLLAESMGNVKHFLHVPQVVVNCIMLHMKVKRLYVFNKHLDS